MPTFLHLRTPARRTAAAGVVLGLAAGLALTIGGPAPAPEAPAVVTPVALTQTGADPGCRGAGCRGLSPRDTGCDHDARTVAEAVLVAPKEAVSPRVDTSEVTLGPEIRTVLARVERESGSVVPDGKAVVGSVEVRWSPACRATWALARSEKVTLTGTATLFRDDRAEEHVVISSQPGGKTSLKGYTPMVDDRPGTLSEFRALLEVSTGATEVRTVTGGFALPDG